MIKYKNPEAAAKATARRHTVKKEVKREPKPSDPFGDDDDDMFNEIPGKPCNQFLHTSFLQTFLSRESGIEPVPYKAVLPYSMINLLKKIVPQMCQI